jgi:hypothetical protein
MRTNLLILLVFALTLTVFGCKKKAPEPGTGMEAVAPADEAKLSLEGMGRYIMNAFRDSEYNRLIEIQAPRQMVADIAQAVQKPEATVRWESKQREQTIAFMKTLRDSTNFERNQTEFKDMFLSLSQSRRMESRVDWPNSVFENVKRVPDPECPLFSILEIHFKSGMVEHVLTVHHLVEHNGKWWLASPRKIDLDRTGLKLHLKDKK